MLLPTFNSASLPAFVLPNCLHSLHFLPNAAVLLTSPTPQLPNSASDGGCRAGAAHGGRAAAVRAGAMQ
eukprot:3839483-Rhodomonas_salina.1